MKILKNFILGLWQIPQNFIAVFITSILGELCYYGGKYKDAHLIFSDFYVSSFSLGEYLFILNGSNQEDILDHEYGHYLQSRILGWLYIPVIVIPSFIHNIYVRIARKLGYDKNYRDFYTERWADKLSEKSKETII